MRFNTSLIVLGLAAAVSAVPISGPLVPEAKTSNEAGTATEPANNLTTRDFGIEVGSGAAGLNRREYAVSVTFKREGGINPTDETEKKAEEMVQATLKNAAKKLKMGEGSELTVTFTNKWPSAFLQKVDFTFEDPVCGSGGACDGEATPGGKGTIKGGAKKRKNAAVLWTQA
ncbi:hypothetical protein F5050DRAFT_168638 [Lentinula boryana]|uniref:Uncharacterized protein n=1 Tax=Lentinula boryana TaxID=40481 RepID=A0ABQ8QC93_9AGAR|nr:hypothetical protein F5050DRAFT_168638 [Lentinula boryana]